MTDDASLWGVPAKDIGDAWPLVDDLIGEALARSGKHTPDEVLADLTKGDAQLWVAWHRDDGVLGVMVTYIVKHPLATICRIWLCVGRDRKRWVHHLEAVEAWAKAAGCGEVVAVVRPGWEKVLTGYKRTHVTLEKAL